MGQKNILKSGIILIIICLTRSRHDRANLSVSDAIIDLEIAPYFVRAGALFLVFYIQNGDYQ